MSVQRLWGTEHPWGPNLIAPTRMRTLSWKGVEGSPTATQLAAAEMVHMRSGKPMCGPRRKFQRWLLELQRRIQPGESLCVCPASGLQF